MDKQYEITLSPGEHLEVFRNDGSLETFGNDYLNPELVPQWVYKDGECFAVSGGGTVRSLSLTATKIAHWKMGMLFPTRRQANQFVKLKRAKLRKARQTK